MLSKLDLIVHTPSNIIFNEGEVELYNNYSLTIDYNIDIEVATFKYIFEGSTQDNSLSPEEISIIENLIAKRDQARKTGNFEEADKIRDKLDKMKVSIKDIDGKTEWTK